MIRRQLVTGLLATICLLVVLTVAYPLVVWGVGRVAFSHQADGSMVKVNGKTVGSSLIGQSFADKSGNPLAQYFQPRPSVTVDSSGNALPYNSANSGASNLGPSNPNLIGNDNGDGQTNPYRTAADPYCVPVQATDTSGNAQTDAQGNPVYQKAADGSYVCNPNTVPERVIAYRQFNGLPAGATVPVDAVTASGSGLDPDISVANALDQANRVASAHHLSAAQVIALVHQHTNGRQWGFLGEKTVNVLDLNVALDRLTPSG